ncbi:MAG: hypothetical protein AAFZ65_02615 [Planctomycetota bacterium]
MGISRRQLMLASAAGLTAAGIDGYVRWRRSPSVAVRDRPPVLRCGPIQRGFPAGQTLRAAGDRLVRVQWTVQGLPDEGALPELFVRLEAPTGAELARATPRASAGEDGSTLLTARFDAPLERDARIFVGLDPPAGRSATRVAPHLRVRAAPGTPQDLGREPLEGPILTRLLRGAHDWLTALAIPFHRLPPGSGPLRLELAELEGVRDWVPYRPQPKLADHDASVTKVVREVSLERPNPIEAGHLPILFEPLTDSRGRIYRLRLALPAGAVAAGAEDGVGYVPWYGVPRERPPLDQAWIGGLPVPRCDLIAAYWFA